MKTGGWEAAMIEKRAEEHERIEPWDGGACRGLKWAAFVLLTMALIFLAGYMAKAYAQTWHTTNQVTVAWDAVTTLEGGGAIPAGNTVEYATWLNDSILDPGKTNPLLVSDNILILSCIITFTAEGRYFLGVQAIRKLADGTEVGRSTISWSDDPAVTPDPFGVMYYVPPASPGGLRLGGGGG